MYEFLKLLRDNLPVNVLHYEYLGYGLAKYDGLTPSEGGVYEAADAAFEYLNTKHKITEKDIIMYVTSMLSAIFIASI